MSNETVTRDALIDEIAINLIEFKRVEPDDPIIDEALNLDIAQSIIDTLIEDCSAEKENPMLYARSAAYLILSAIPSRRLRNPISKSDYEDDIETLEAQSEMDSHSLRYEVATNPNTPIEILERLSRDRSTLVVNGVAKNLNTPPDILDAIADRGGSRDTKIILTLNPNTTAETLDKLSYAYDGRVRWNVARNPRTLLETILRLADDEFDQVREVVALNPITPEDALIRLSRDEKREVRLCAKAAMRVRGITL